MAEQPLPGVFFLTDESGFWSDLDDVFVPDVPPNDAPDAWLSGDGLLVFLSDSEGAPLAFLSMDEPASRLRPTGEDLRLIRAFCLHAEQALESARRTERAGETERALSLLLEASPALTACDTPTELIEMAGAIVVPQLGFERFAGFLAQSDALELRATRGWSDEDAIPTGLAVAQVEALLAPERSEAGCFLGRAVELFGPPAGVGEPGIERSARNGRGATAWRDHCLLVPCRGADGGLRGLIAVEDPVDRRLPTVERRRALRLLGDLVSAALPHGGQPQGAAHLARHDPLTGVRSRNQLDEVLAAHTDVALLLCDLDDLGAIKARHGRAVGDRVLARFGELLRELARDDDVPLRLGGDAFCVVLPGTDLAGASGAAERLRAQAADRLRELVPEGVSASVGLAATSAGVPDAHGLLAAAQRSLADARASAPLRDDVVVHGPWSPRR